MLAAQIIWLVSTTVGMIVSYLEFRHSQQMYHNWTKGEGNGLGMQVASHQVRVSVANVVTHAIQLTVAAIGVAIMWFRLDDWNLTQIMLTGATQVAVLTMLKQLIYRYDRALIADAAQIAQQKELRDAKAIIQNNLQLEGKENV